MFLLQQLFNLNIGVDRLNPLSIEFIHLLSWIRQDRIVRGIVFGLNTWLFNPLRGRLSPACPGTSGMRPTTSKQIKSLCYRHEPTCIDDKHLHEIVCVQDGQLYSQFVQFF
jgi:hypothetical protein